MFFDEGGHPIRLQEDMNARPIILVLNYYGCKNLCDVLLDGLVKSLNDVPFKAGTDFSVVSISIDPSDTPAIASEKKREILKRYYYSGTGAGWHFLTGTQASIQQVADAVGFKYVYDRERKEYLHALGIVLLTPQSRTSRYFYGVDFPPRDLTFGLIEASADRIGSPIDRALVRCFHYDPATGKYSIAIIFILRVACLFLVAAGALWILFMLRREKTRV
jgi:protein SCO1/2